MESDPQSASIITQLLILLVLTLVNAFFSGSEMAVVSVNKNKIHRLAEQGNKNAALIERLMEDSTVFLSTIQVAITLAGFFCGYRYCSGTGSKNEPVECALQPDGSRSACYHSFGLF